MSKLTLVFFGTLTGVLVWAGYNIIPFYYYYYELQNQFDAAIRVASEYTDQEIRQKLMYHIKKMEIPAEDEDLKINRYDNRMQISLDYAEEFYVTWKEKDYTIHTFPFHAEVDRVYIGSAGGQSGEVAPQY